MNLNYQINVNKQNVSKNPVQCEYMTFSAAVLASVI